MTRSARFRRLPLRARLVTGFSATMLLLLLAAGLFVYWRVDFALGRQLDDDLSEISARLTPQVSAAGPLLPTAPAADQGEIYQVLDRQGRVLASGPTTGPTLLLGPDDARRALSAPVRRDIGALLPIKNHPLRAYAVPLDTGGVAAVLVVAVRRDHRDEALLELLVQLAVAGAGTLVLTSGVGYLLARSALRPVEAYRAQAAQVVEGVAGVRLARPEQREDEVTRLGETLNAMLTALETALERERDFVRDASHELRTPLTLLTTRVQLALSRPRSTAEHEEVLREIRTDLDRLQRLAEQLLDGGLAGSHGSADLGVTARDRVRRRLPGLDHPDDLTIDEQGAPGLPVAIDETTLARLVDNVLTNSLLHGAPPVAVTADQLGGHARLLVRDSGAGMDAQLLATATQRFSRAAESRQRPGFGLGLALVERIVVGAGGELRLCSDGHHHRSGRLVDVPCSHDGAMTVTVLLPLQPAEAPSPARDQVVVEPRRSSTP